MRTGLLAFGLITLFACQNGSHASDEHLTEMRNSVYDVYFLAGQSNMDGLGLISELPEDLKKPQMDVPIFMGNAVPNGEDGGGLGLWSVMQPGFGTGFYSDGTINSLSDRFGPELAFAAQLRAARPDQKIAIIKYAKGGSALALGVSEWGDWALDYSDANSRNQYDNALTTIASAMAERDIDGDGHPDQLNPAGIIWMQGESDAAHTAETAAAYADNLSNMMNLLRAALHVDDLPVVIGQIRDSGDTPETRVMPYSPEVIAIQNRYAQTDSCAAIVTVTEGFDFPDDDPWHYLSENYVQLGSAFADAVLDLQLECGSAR